MLKKILFILLILLLFSSVVAADFKSSNAGTDKPDVRFGEDSSFFRVFFKLNTETTWVMYLIEIKDEQTNKYALASNINESSPTPAGDAQTGVLGPNTRVYPVTGTKVNSNTKTISELAAAGGSLYVNVCGGPANENCNNPNATIDPDKLNE